MTRTKYYPLLGTVDLLLGRHTSSADRRVMQEASKAHKTRAKKLQSVEALQRDAVATAQAHLDTNGQALDDLLSNDSLTTLVLSGDWHGNASAAAIAFRAAAEEGASAVVQVGDLGVWPRLDGQAFLDTLEHLAAHYEIPLLFVDGNHEDFTQLAAAPRHETGLGIMRPGVYHLGRGMVWTWGGYRFGALGGAPSIDREQRKIGESWWPEEVITDSDVATLARNAGGEPLDVLLTHDTVSDAPLPSRRFRLPAAVQMDCDHSRSLVYRATSEVTPSLLVHGHYHESKFYESAYTDVLSMHMEYVPGSLALLTLDS